MLKQQWLDEEKRAKVHGWDFSVIEDRYESMNPPWDYRSLIEKYLQPTDKLLDIDTGGGEFLLSLNHDYKLMSATEGYPPNVKLCQETLTPLGIDIRATDGSGKLPFDDAVFDIVINRHGLFNIAEIKRVLKPGGIFITQQVGAENDREFVEMLLPSLPLPFPKQYMAHATAEAIAEGFTILEQAEAHMPIRFYDVCALVWFAKVIQWEFIDFSVEKCLENLYHLEEEVKTQGYIEGRGHLYMIVWRK